jgi:hypothetical protein
MTALDSSVTFDAVAEARAEPVAAWPGHSRPDAQIGTGVNGELVDVGRSDLARISALLRTGWGKRLGAEGDLRRWLRGLESSPDAHLTPASSRRLDGIYRRALEPPKASGSPPIVAASAGKVAARQRRQGGLPEPKRRPMAAFLADDRPWPREAAFGRPAVRFLAWLFGGCR